MRRPSARTRSAPGSSRPAAEARSSRRRPSEPHAATDAFESGTTSLVSSGLRGRELQRLFHFLLTERIARDHAEHDRFEAVIVHTRLTDDAADDGHVAVVEAPA